MCFWSMSGSMSPAIRIGDKVALVPGRQCRAGDIILYRRGNRLMLHRVVGKWRGVVITKGDALDQVDEPVTLRDILGRAVSRERGGVTHSLDSLWSRFLGLAFCLTVSWVPKLMAILAAVKRLGCERLGLAGL